MKAHGVELYKEVDYRTLYEKEKEKLSLCMETLESISNFCSQPNCDNECREDEYECESKIARDTLSKLKDGE